MPRSPWLPSTRLERHVSPRRWSFGNDRRHLLAAFACLGRLNCRTPRRRLPAWPPVGCAGFRLRVSRSGVGAAGRGPRPHRDAGLPAATPGGRGPSPAHGPAGTGGSGAGPRGRTPRRGIKIRSQIKPGRGCSRAAVIRRRGWLPPAGRQPVRGMLENRNAPCRRVFRGQGAFRLTPVGGLSGEGWSGHDGGAEAVFGSGGTVATRPGTRQGHAAEQVARSPGRLGRRADAADRNGMPQRRCGRGTRPGHRHRQLAPDRTRTAQRRHRMRRGRTTTEHAAQPPPGRATPWPPPEPPHQSPPPTWRSG